MYQKFSVKPAFTLIELLIVVAIIGILAAIAVPNFLSAQLRALIAKTNGDMDAIAKGCMMFYLDRGHFPPATDRINETYLIGKVEQVDADEFYTFQTNHRGSFVPHLTSPNAYINFIPIDPFSAHPKLPYGYAGGKRGYISTSFGPDRDQSEGINDIFHRGDINEVSAFMQDKDEMGEENHFFELSGSPSTLRFYLLPRTFDPSNGLTSNGDIWRGNI